MPTWHLLLVYSETLSPVSRMTSWDVSGTLQSSHKGKLRRWVKKIERCPGEPVMTFSGLGNRNSLKCSTHLGKEKRKGLIFMPVIGKAQGWRRLQASRALDNGTLCMAARSPGVASCSHCPCMWDPGERAQIFPKGPAKKHGLNSDYSDSSPMFFHEEHRR